MTWHRQDNLIGDTACPPTLPRIFIKPGGGPSMNWERRASFAGIPAIHHQPNLKRGVSRPSLPASEKPTIALSRRPSFSVRVNPPPKAKARSSMALRPTQATPRKSTNRSKSTMAFARAHEPQLGAMTLTYSSEDKENVAPIRTSSNPRKSIHRKQPFIRNPSPLIPAGQQKQQPSPPRNFLAPRGGARKSLSAVLLPRTESIPQVVPKQQKKEFLLPKKSTLPALPTIIMQHTPVQTPENTPKSSKKAKQSLERTQQRHKQSSPSPALLTLAKATSCLTPVMAHSPRLFLAPATGIRSSSSLNSMLSLPSQVLKHTPISLFRKKAKMPSCVSNGSNTPASGSPCISKARTKSVWTMMDEMKLVRNGGMLGAEQQLQPESQVRIVPLCKRIRNGASADSPSPNSNGEYKRRSVSMPYHLLVSGERGGIRPEPPLPPDPSIARCIAISEAGRERKTLVGSADLLQEDIPIPQEDVNSKEPEEKYNWTIVDIKKPGLGSLRRAARASISGAKRASSGGYGVTSGIGSVSSRPSFLTRAQTMVKMKVNGSRSRKVVGGGLPGWA